MAIARSGESSYDVLCSQCGTHISIVDISIRNDKESMERAKKAVCFACVGPVPILSDIHFVPGLEGLEIIEAACSNPKALQLKIDQMGEEGWSVYIMDDSQMGCVITRPISRSAWKEKKMNRIIIAGCRTFEDRKMGFAKLDYITRNMEKNSIIAICGMARGADMIGHEWADERGITVEEYLAEWGNINVPGARIHKRNDGSEYNSKAGIDRNVRMAVQGRATHLIAFWDRKSRGTRNMIDIATKLGIKIRIIDIKTGVISVPA